MPSYGQDPCSNIRQTLVGTVRSCQFLFESRDQVDFPAQPAVATR
jgi:hypothetical protein